MRRIRASKSSRMRLMNSLRSCARRVAVCQDLRARRRGKPNCLHLPMTINDKTGPPQKVAVCQDRLGMANRTASRVRWQGVAATPPSPSPRLPASQPTIARRHSSAFPFSLPPAPFCLSRHPTPGPFQDAPRHPGVLANAPASWIAVALHRFSLPTG